MRFSFRYKIITLCIAASALPLVLVCYFAGISLLYSLLALLACTLISGFFAAQLSAPLIDGMNSLETGLLNFKDGELATLLAYDGSDELGDLCRLYNQTAKQLRQEKQWIYQRELMLDKVLQSSPQAVLLTNDQGFIVYSNHSARSLLDAKSALEGTKLENLLDSSCEQLTRAIHKGVDGLFTLDKADQESQTWHMATGRLLLNNQFHQLYVFKQLTRELSRQEVEVWKKVIRIISHELNNSLGPMSSMLHSAQLLTKEVDEPRLKRVFTTIEERIKHLNEFVQGYGKFAKLPTPQLSTINWPTLIEQLKSQWQVKVSLDERVTTDADHTQLEQLLINLLKNAYESGSNPEDVSLTVQQEASGTHITVSDKGKGMSEAVMANALIPFYSTKATGSGLGLALCREIVEAHHGQISLHNREQGGLSVHVLLP
ncbi:ATP-binding protein [Pseudoalteromonas sp. B5MOD-1]|uniref:sensor histidine kinase n=1 Tax=Pseudoalteromonas TaxID=53246 RepID=UPI0007819E9A|nr:MULTISPECIES: ATP-binding protein [Pseudoalteromonas]MCO7206642.1 ATP-binding protein [Pseudoalteromonas sp. CnMc7-37]